MGFSPMDGFFLAVFLAVCIVVAVVLRCLCYRCCMQSCSDKFRHPNADGILPRHSTPTITPAGWSGNNQRPQQHRRHHSPQLSSPQQLRPVLPSAGTVFTIYTFPQQASPELHRPNRSPGPPKYSTVPADSPPKYEDLFPLTSKEDTSFSSSPSSMAIEMQVATQQQQQQQQQQEQEQEQEQQQQQQQQQQQHHPSTFSESHEPPLRDSTPVQAHTSSTTFNPEGPLIPAVPRNNSSLSRNASPSPVAGQAPVCNPKEDPPLYDTIYPQKSGE